MARASSTGNAGAQSHILTVKYDELNILLDEAIRADTATLVRGEPGIGKTEIIYNLGKKLDREIVETRFQYIQATDVKFPLISNGRYTYVIPEEWPLYDTTKYSDPPARGRGILWLLDEIPFVQSRAVYHVINEVMQYGRIGKYAVFPGTVMVGTGNRLCDKTDAVPLTSTLANRLGHVELDARNDVEGWLRWAYQNNAHFTVLDYIQEHKGQKLFTFDSNWVPDTPFASPRSVMSLGDKLHKLKLDETNIISGLDTAQRQAGLLLGPAWAADFAIYVECYKALTSMEEITKDPMRAPMPQLDAKTGVAGTLVAQFGRMGRALNAKNIPRVIQYSERMKNIREAGAMVEDLKAYMFSLAFHGKEGNAIQRTREFSDWAMKNHRFLTGTLKDDAS